ncbi:MAG TPA: MotA/TolQ/ExbB proton channel family protein [Polyangiaceae bacterium]|jgi:biopolymer transport protein TolQ|nr:MotA/TolQ/ExbB proton channel family protein [Polyangiaceae bacterium]
METNFKEPGAASSDVLLDPVSLLLGASGPVFFVVWLLVAASALVWVVTALKLLQLRRLTALERAFEAEAAEAGSARDLLRAARRHEGAPGARVVLELAARAAKATPLDAVAKRALVREEQQAGSLLSTLASIASAAPFVGLFGTVYGIMDAFLRIGREKSASLPVVAPAIGEALIATAIGLFAAIPAVVAYNALNKRLDDLLAGLEASLGGWVAIASSAGEATPSGAREAGSLQGGNAGTAMAVLSAPAAPEG